VTLSCTRISSISKNIVFSYVNFCYFVSHRQKLASTGLLPSFLRVEYSAIRQGYVSIDNPHIVNVANLPFHDIGDSIVISVPQPYCACFALDIPLAVEYVNSKSFNMEASKQLCHWGIRERAAMGLCFEQIPKPFRHRYVVPIVKDTGMPPSWTWVWHMPNTYADNPAETFGKIRMDELFTNGATVSQAKVDQ
jgi:hypothetical protein